MSNTNPEQFDIEDIIREFGSSADEALPEEDLPLEDLALEETIPENAEEAPCEDTQEEDIPEEEYEMDFSLPQEFFEEPEPAIFEDEVDTIRLDNVSEIQTNREEDFSDTRAIPTLEDLPHNEQLQGEEDLAATQRISIADLGDTQRVNMADLASAQQENVADLGDTQKVPVQEPENAPNQRRFVLHPQSNPLKELKKQLTAGPERLYYQMAEKGTGKLAAAILVNLVLVLLCGTVIALQAFHVLGETYLRAVIFGQIFSMFLSALLGSFQLIDGAADLLRKRFSLNTLLGFSFLVCIADGVLALKELRIPCCAAFCLAMTFSQLAAYHKRSTLSSRLDTMRKATSLKGTYAAFQEDGRKVFVSDEGKVDHFMDSIYKRSKPEKYQGYYAMGVLVISFLLGVGTVFWKDISAGVQVWAVSMLLALPACSFITSTRPVAILERRLHKLGAVLCGWQALETAAGKADYPVAYQDLFPEGCSKMNGVKFFGSLSPDQVVSYAASLIQATESGLTPLFLTLLENHNGVILDADDLQAYEHGVGGQIAGVPVLAGSLSFLRQMGVEADESLYIGQSVCVAIDGELSGMFAITYEKNKSSAAGLQTLTSYRGLRAAIVAADPMLTGNFLQKKFGIRQRRLHFPDYPTRQSLRSAVPEEGSKPILLATKKGLAETAYGVTGARSAYTASMLGTLIQMIGGIVGLVILAILVIIGALYLITPLNMFLYQLIWLIPGWLITEWARTI